MKTEILVATPQNIARVAAALKADSIVGIPTETVYGLAGNAFSVTATTKIFQAKERPTFDPLIVHVAAKPALKFSTLDYLSELGLIPEKCFLALLAERLDILCGSFWPGPLTLVMPRAPEVPDLVSSGLPTVAIRIPSHPVAQALLEQSGPLAAPSANRFGHISPTSSGHVMSELGGRIPLILDGGKCSIGIESTVLLVDPSGTIRLLRPGGTPVEKLETMLGARITRSSRGPEPDGTGRHSHPQMSPGMLSSHYAPVKPLYLLKAAADKLTPHQVIELTARLAATPGPLGILLFSPDEDKAVSALAHHLGRSITKLVLCPMKTPEEAARNLFSMMRKLDESAVAVLLSEPCPWADGLGYGIMDRLTRASTPAR